MFGHETVPDPGLRSQILRSGGVDLQLSAELQHVHTKVVELIFMVWSPHFLQ
jgi:hypothetical protein